MKVLVGNGEKLKSHGYCHNVSIIMQKQTVQADFYLLPLPDYDVVLGAQWLQTLGSIIWDFAYLTMTFTVEGKELNFKGKHHLISRCVDSKTMDRVVLKSTQGFLF